MPPSDPPPGPPRLTRGWWAGLLSGLAIIPLWCLFNALVDPIGQFGQSGRYVFNRAPPAAAIAAGESGGDPAFFDRAIRERGADVFLIGSSRTWRGFDTCARPDMLRVAGSAWGLRELARVERTVLKGRRTPATLLIEVGVPTRERAATRPAEAAISTALSPRTTLLSVQTVAAGLADPAARPATYAPCAPLAPVPQNWREAERSLRYSLSMLDTTPASLAQGRRNLLAMADAADQVCRRTGVRHRLIFFALPPGPAGSPAPRHDRLVRANAARIASEFARRPVVSGACDIRFVNYGSSPPGDPALWRDRDQWMDYVHFSSRLGAMALDALIGPAGEGSRVSGP